MKYPILVILFALFFTDIKGQSTTPDSDDVTQESLSQLYELVHKLHPKVKFKRDEVMVGDSSIKIKPWLEFDGQRQGKWIHAVTFVTSINNTTNVSVGIIGLGANAQEAINSSINEWSMVFGVPFTNMLIDSKPVKLSIAKIYPGLMGIRGTMPKDTWLQGDDEMVLKILKKIEAELIQRPEKLYTLDIKLTVGGAGVEGGEIRIADQVSPELFNSIKTLDWPPSSDKYMFRQFYLIRK